MEGSRAKAHRHGQRQDAEGREALPASLGEVMCADRDGRVSIGRRRTGFGMGPALDENIRRSMMIARGDVLAILRRPIVASLLAAGVTVVVVVSLWRRKRVVK